MKKTIKDYICNTFYFLRELSVPVTYTFQAASLGFVVLWAVPGPGPGDFSFLYMSHMQWVALAIYNVFSWQVSLRLFASEGEGQLNT